MLTRVQLSIMFWPSWSSEVLSNLNFGERTSEKAKEFDLLWVWTEKFPPDGRAEKVFIIITVEVAIEREGSLCLSLSPNM